MKYVVFRFLSSKYRNGYPIFLRSLFWRIFRPSCTYNSQVLISQLSVTQPLLSSFLGEERETNHHNNTYFHCLATRTFLKCKSVKKEAYFSDWPNTEKSSETALGWALLYIICKKKVDFYKSSKAYKKIWYNVRVCIIMRFIYLFGAGNVTWSHLLDTFSVSAICMPPSRWIWAERLGFISFSASNSLKVSCKK